MLVYDLVAGEYWTLIREAIDQLQSAQSGYLTVSRTLYDEITGEVSAQERNSPCGFNYVKRTLTCDTKGSVAEVDLWRGGYSTVVGMPDTSSDADTIEAKSVMCVLVEAFGKRLHASQQQLTLQLGILCSAPWKTYEVHHSTVGSWTTIVKAGLPTASKGPVTNVCRECRLPNEWAVPAPGYVCNICATWRDRLSK